MAHMTAQAFPEPDTLNPKIMGSSSSPLYTTLPRFPP